jgi:hypothetical protein
LAEIVLDYGRPKSSFSCGSLVDAGSCAPGAELGFLSGLNECAPLSRAGVAGVERFRSTMGLLAGMRVLVVEDDPVTGIDITEVIQGADGEVVGPIKSIKEAGRVAKTEALDFAVLDVNLADGEITPVLESLYARKIPLLVYTGSVLPDGISRRHPDLTTLKKPVLPARLLGEISKTHRGSRA